MKVYLSGPITHNSYDQATSWRDSFADALRVHGHIPLDPMRGKSFLSNQDDIAEERYQGKERPHLSDKALMLRDFNDVRAADVVLVNLLPEGEKGMSRGTAYELAWAYAEQKLTVIVQDPASPLAHPFIRETGVIFGNLVEALAYILDCEAA